MTARELKLRLKEKGRIGLLFSKQLFQEILDMLDFFELKMDHLQVAKNLVQEELEVKNKAVEKHERAIQDYLSLAELINPQGKMPENFQEFRDLLKSFTDLFREMITPSNKKDLNRDFKIMKRHYQELVSHLGRPVKDQTESVRKEFQEKINSKASEFKSKVMELDAKNRELKNRLDELAGNLNHKNDIIKNLEAELEEKDKFISNLKQVVGN